jgi:hypothetical protein
MNIEGRIMINEDRAIGRAGVDELALGFGVRDGHAEKSAATNIGSFR